MNLRFSNAYVGTIRIRENQYLINDAFLAELDNEGGEKNDKPFDAIAVGTYRPGNWYADITFTQDELTVYLENTLAAIEAAVDDKGNMVGLPIDQFDHNHGSGAAGWIVGAFIEEDRIRVIPRWTDVGRASIAEGKYRWFSGDIDVVSKVIHGGTLTNWPAMKDADGKNRLRAIALSSKLTAKDGEDSITAHIRNVAKTFYSMISDGWVIEVFETELIAEVGTSIFKIGYSVDEEEHVVFSAQNEWVEVKQAYVEASADDETQAIDAGDKPSLTDKLMKNVKSLVDKAKGKQKLTADEILEIANQVVVDEGEYPTTNVLDNSQTSEGENMDPLYENMSKEEQALAQKAALTALFPILEGETQEEHAQRLSSFSVLDNPETLVGLQEQQRVLLSAQMESIRKETEIKMRKEMSAIQHAGEVASFTNDAILGKATNKGTFPVDTEVFTKFLSGLTPVQFKDAVIIFAQILKQGLVDLSETGNEKVTEGSHELDEDTKALLTTHLKSEGNTVAEFFKINQNMLGEMSDYNLEDFKKEAV